MTIKKAPLSPAGHMPDHTIRVLSFRPGQQYIAAMTGPALALWTHYADTGRGYRTRPCMSHGCQLCGTHRSIWRAYAPGCILKLNDDGEWRWQLAVIPISRGYSWLADSLNIGRIYVLTRRHRAPNSPIECTEWRGSVTAPLPPPFDLMPILGKMWGIDLSSDDDASSHGLCLELDEAQS